MAKQRLGTNLNALLGSARLPASLSNDLAGPSPVKESLDGTMKDLPVEFLVRGKYQPRRDMHPDALEELAESIKEQGIMQPIVVRPAGQNRYEIIAGERRWRAAQLAGLADVPALIRDVPDEAAIAMALIENIQREDLNPIEEAIALSRLQKEFELTQQEVAQAVGKSRAAVANILRLMALNPEVKKMLEYGDLEMGHARALLSLGELDQLEVARTVTAKGLSVRQTEALVRRIQQEKEKGGKTVKRLDPNIKQLEDELSEKVGARVAIQCSAKGKGKLVISYNSLDELDGVLAHIQ
ncbi:ParB/RepB/Spo0J family partition protein [Endozoicomonas acroporae]|uniref:ParB/RepB/Spo0J family partition protein n=1 Tax=Endozoicomonas TaxID=305899 RepID=UPI000C774F10|nr:MULTISPECIES: ParB/RepB/Spo0J family partition protein [Endozoicomonas]WBA81777.1 ParB/RepB/Spo0J family partition protein [Endozoicomonas sp. GU-1]WBA84732.1 ParB/RepB/Spo0J family partition protein [Endozoicomonas sp. GU-1]